VPLGSGNEACLHNQFLLQAKAEMGKWSPFGFGSSDKHERAAELYERAGNAFKGAKKCECAPRLNHKIFIWSLQTSALPSVMPKPETCR